MSQVIACIDTDNRVAHSVCDYAAWAASTLPAPLCFLHVMEKVETPSALDLSGNIGPDAQSDLLKQMVAVEEQRARLQREQGRMLLKQASQRVQDQHQIDATSLQRSDELLATVDELESDTRLLVIGRKGSHAEAPLGSHVEQLIRGQHKPLLIAIGDYQVPSKCVIAFDGSETARKLVGMIADSPLLKDLPCILLMVGHDDAKHRKQLQQAEQRLRDTGHEVTTLLRQGDVEGLIADTLRSEQANLLVMGAYGHSKIRQWLVGSTTTRLLQTSQVPILVLR
jgi:nucleotide-binding universal stress UspA family protein